MAEGETDSVELTYTISDNNGGTDDATVTIIITGVNDAPVAANDAYVVDEDQALNIAALGVLGNDTDVEGDALTVALLSGPSSGTLGLNADGSFSYTPNADFNGTDSFTYLANDGDGSIPTSPPSRSPSTAVNDAPVAADDTYSVNEDNTLNVAAAECLAMTPMSTVPH